MTAHRTPEPRGKTLEFVEAVRAKYDDAFVRSWLSSKTCRFTDTSVFTIALGVERLKQYCAAEIEKFGITVAMCPDVTRALYSQVDGHPGGKP